MTPRHMLHISGCSYNNEWTVLLIHVIITVGKKEAAVY